MLWAVCCDKTVIRVKQRRRVYPPGYALDLAQVIDFHGCESSGRGWHASRMTDTHRSPTLTRAITRAYAEKDMSLSLTLKFNLVFLALFGPGRCCVGMQRRAESRLLTWP